MNMQTKEIYNPNYDALLFLRSCEKEVIEPIQGKISGNIPEWLNGALLRNGPGMSKIGEYEFQHLFDCMAFLQRFEIKNGNVTFQCRYLQSDVYKENTKANRIVFTDFGTSSIPDPCHSIFQRFFSWFEKNELPDNACISLYPFGDEIYSFCETPFMFKIDKETLETKKKVDLRNLSIVTHSSHPHVTEDGSVYNLALTKQGPEHCIVCFPHKPKEDENDYSMYDKGKIVASIPVRWRLHPSYMHSFGITRNYFIIVEQPMTLSLPKLYINSWTNAPVIDCLKAFSNELTQISVVSRNSGTLSYKFYSKSFFYFHIINQYEDENHIILDVCAYDTESIFHAVSVHSLKNVHNNRKYTEMFRSTPIRLVLPLLDSYENLNTNENLISLKNTGAKAFLQENGTILVEWENLSDLGCELPIINYNKYRGEKYQYFYAISADLDDDYPGCLIKVNTKDKTATRWYEKDCFANEPIFVPNPEPQSEDDGILLSNIVWRYNAYRTGLVVLNAKTMQEIGRAEFETPGEIAKGFHGWYCTN